MILLSSVFFLIPLNFEGYYWYTILGCIWYFLCSISYTGLLVYCNMKYGVRLSSAMYGYLLLATAFTTINLGFLTSITPYIGYTALFYIIASLMLIGAVLSLCLNEIPYIFGKKSSHMKLI